jgi:hypothetical protein
MMERLARRYTGQVIALSAIGILFLVWLKPGDPWPQDILGLLQSKDRAKLVECLAQDGRGKERDR